MTSSLAHLLTFAAGCCAVALPGASPPASPPAASHVVATASTPIVVEVVPDVFAPPTPDECAAFDAHRPLHTV